MIREDGSHGPLIDFRDPIDREWLMTWYQIELIVVLKRILKKGGEMAQRSKKKPDLPDQEPRFMFEEEILKLESVMTSMDKRTVVIQTRIRMTLKEWNRINAEVAEEYSRVIYQGGILHRDRRDGLIAAIGILNLTKLMKKVMKDEPEGS